MAKQTKKIEVPVKFGAYGGKGAKAHISFTIPRADMTPTSASFFLCGTQLKVQIKADPNAKNDIEGQQVFKNMGGSVFEAIADSSQVSMKPKEFSGSLKFNSDEVDAKQLKKLSGSSGRMILDHQGKAPEDETEDEDKADGEEGAEEGDKE